MLGLQQQEREREFVPHRLCTDDYNNDDHRFGNGNHDVVEHPIHTGSIESCRLDNLHGNRCIIRCHDIGAEGPEICHPDKNQAQIVVNQMQLSTDLENLD
ncbi:hypothetical protein SDC9_165738 [bioreactor metagenome]|uniref:Uncharacterized protein n=1 Tax=bioreactor metagenome TaxID=1076179 RepID=A0A645FV22_9ZZZZ